MRRLARALLRRVRVDQPELNPAPADEQGQVTPVVYLGFGHPLPWFLAVLGAVLIVVLPFLIAAYIREALGPHPTDQEES